MYPFVRNHLLDTCAYHADLEQPSEDSWCWLLGRVATPDVDKVIIARKDIRPMMPTDGLQ